MKRLVWVTGLEMKISYWRGKEKEKRDTSLFLQRAKFITSTTPWLPWSHSVPCQHDLAGFTGHQLMRETLGGPLDSAIGTAQSCKISAKAGKSANTVMGCSLLCPTGCQNSTNHQTDFSLRRTEEVIAKCSTVGVMNYIHITYRYEYRHISSIFTCLK